MSANTALITEGAQDAASQHMLEYADGVAKHFNGDWSGHNQVNVVNQPFTGSNGSVIPNSKTLRMIVTIGDQDVAVLIPIVPISAAVSSEVPAIVSQPTGGKATFKGTFRLSVRVTGAAPLSYQWSKNGIPIAGAVSRDFTVTNTKLSDAGNYTVLVSNSNGVASSEIAVVQVIVPVNAQDAESDSFNFFGLIFFPL